MRGALLAGPKDSDVEAVVAHLMRMLYADRQPGLSAGRRASCAAGCTTSVRRAYRPAGMARQMVAIAADGDRSPLLAASGAPTQIIHGAADPLVPVAAGARPGGEDRRRELDIIDGMGHDLPRALWPRFADGIATAAGRA